MDRPWHRLALSVSSPIKIDIWSDIACPWCYIGKRHLEAGIAALGDEAPEVEIEYHSYELSPDTPVDFEGSAADFLAGHKRLPVEQVQVQVQPVAHAHPAVVRSIRGRAASDTNDRITTYTLAMPLARRPLRCSPMISRSLATTRIGT